MLQSESTRLSEFCDGKLYGREKQVKELREAFSRAKEPEQRAQIVLIGGASGTGKSALMNKALDLPGNHLLVGTGKFTEQKHTKPYEVLANSLMEVCQGISELENKYDYCTYLTEKLDQEQLTVLAGLIPNLTKIISTENERLPDSDDFGRSKESLEKLKYALRGFVEAISRHDYPLVIVLDDLHWVDPSTLDILKAVAANAQLKHFIFMGSYRDNEVDSRHSLMQWMDEMKDDLQQVQIGNLSEDDIGELLTDILKVEDTESLAALLHQRTDGNILHVLRLLDHLQMEELMEYSFSKFCWTWDLDEIRNQTSVDETVAQMLQSRIAKLGESEQACLKLCSCLGFRIDLQHLTLIKDAIQTQNVGNLSASLEFLVREGLLERLSDNRLKFVHDKVHEAAINLLEESTRQKLHLDIGMALLKAYDLDQSKTLSTADDQALFLCTDQLNRSRELINDYSFQVQLAMLNVAVAKRAAMFSAFLPSAEYLGVGISLLDPSSMWRDHYSLALELFTSLAEMSFCAGNWEKQREAIEQVLRHAKSIDDSFRASLTRTQWQMADGKTALAVDSSLLILNDLGQHIPPKPSRYYKKRIFSRLKRRLKSMTNEQILVTPQMTNQRKIKVMRVLTEMILAIYDSLEGNPNLSPVVMCCMVQIHLDFGCSTYSAVAFSCIAVHFANEGDIAMARRFVELSEVLVQRRECQATKARVRFFQYLAAHWWTPLCLMTDGCIEGYHTGMQSGDVFYAFVGICTYISAYFFSGLPLGPLLSDMEKFLLQMFDYRQKLTVLMNLPLYQCVINLTEGACDLTNLSDGKSKAFREKLDWDGGGGMQTEKSLRMQIAFYTENFDLATSVYEELKDVDVGMSKGIFFVQARVMFFALIAIWQFKQTGKRRWKAAAKKYYNMLRGWVVGRRSVNAAHKLLILDAEMMSLDMKVDLRKTMNTYDKAIAASTRAGFLQDAALGAHLASRSLPDESKIYFLKALELYLNWGAKGIADFLQAKRDRMSSREFISPQTTEIERASSGYRSRARFDRRSSLKHKTLEIHHGSERRESIRQIQ